MKLSISTFIISPLPAPSSTKLNLFGDPKLCQKLITQIAIISEKSPTLINIQKKKLIKNNIRWIPNINKINKDPSIFVANEFFDAIAIKQFYKKKSLWFEKFVNLEN